MFGFGKKDSNDVVAPVTGKCVRIEEVPDQVFSTKMMGDGFAVIPESETVVAPMAGEIVMVPDSKHAFGMKTKSGVELLVHIGLDTVELNGEGFTVLSKQGSKVKAGDPVIRFDKAFMESKGINMITMTIFTGGYDKPVALDCYDQRVEAGQVVIR